MWLNRTLLEHILTDNKEQQASLDIAHIALARSAAESQSCREQKAKDDIQIDWLRHRVNQLEKERQVLLMKAAGIAMPIPEMQTVPNVVSTPQYEIPSFDDMGDDAAKKAGILHDDSGEVIYKQA